MITLFKALMAVLAFIAIVKSSPVDLKKGKKIHASITQVSRGLRMKNAPLDMLRAYGKRNKKVPHDVIVAVNASTAAAAHRAGPALMARQTGSDPNYPGAYDLQYVAPVQIGDNGQTLYLDFDTGSADLWVFSTEQPANEQVNHNLYNPSSSGTAQRYTGEAFYIRYHDYSTAYGDVYIDTVNVGGIVFPSQAVETAQHVSPDFLNRPLDGLLGLGFSSNSAAYYNKVNTFFDNVKYNLDAPIFTATLKYQQPGSYDFGYIDYSKFTGDIAYTPVNPYDGYSPGQWEFTASDAATGIGITAIADTGTSLIYVDQGIVNNYYQGIQTGSVNGMITVSCGESLPDFSLVIGGEVRTTWGYLLNYAPADNNGNCYSGIQSSGGGLNIIGDAFLKSQFVVFDGATPQIGFAQQA